MKNRKRTRRNGLVYLDAEKLERQMLRLGLTRSGLADRTGLSRNTVIKALQREGIFPNSAGEIAKALGFEDVTELLPARLQDEKLADGVASRDTGEWDLDAYLGPWITTSNGLQFRICRMRHRFVENRFGRGKWYDLLDPSTRCRENLRTQLLRHATICERIGLHPHVIENLSTYPGHGEDSWWVLDRWFDATPLDQLLKLGPFPRAQLPRLMTEIALGLEALHKAQVVFRELAPSRVLLSSSDGRAVLTDFELAKILQVVPTVSASWPDDPYRALEVDDGDAAPSADLFSWARILVHAATGHLPPKGQDRDALTRAGLPKAIWRVASDCLSPNPSGRPTSVTPVLRALQGWVTS